jgi:SWI/SNF-related matrix-associated actin-dependent regulator 1 of chromatin subfamily A
MLITYRVPFAHGFYVPNNEPVFVALASYEEKDLIKSFGFRWDKQLQLDKGDRPGYWWTGDAAIAARAAAYCDELAAPHVRKLAASRKASRQASIDVDFPAPAGREYLPFQKVGIVYARSRPSTLIGDEMGLGKTIQAIGVINTMEKAPERVLIIAPASLKLNWRRELDRWLVHPLSVGIATSQSIPPANVVIINYDILRKHADYLKSIVWDVLIVDEAHYLKNPDAQRSQAAYSIRALRTLFLTGTPIVNRPMELYPLIHHLDPERWKNSSQFRFRYTVWGDKNGGKNLEELQDILRSTIMIRRLKSDVLTELPPKRRQIIELPASAEQKRALNDEMRAFAEARGYIAAGTTDDEWMTAVDKLKEGEWGDFTELSALRHMTALSKVPNVIEHVKEVLEEKPKVVVFGHHRDVLEQIFDGLAEYHPVMLHGDTPMDLRQRNVDRFQHVDSCRVFVASITAAGVGITLTAADTVVFAELDWTPGNMKQAEDRCHRIGAEVHESILIQHITLEGSMDVGMAQLLCEKLETIERAMDRKPVVASAEPEVGSAAANTRPAATQGPRQRSESEYPDIPGGFLQLEALKKCFQILASLDPDRAGILNDVGFNGTDTTFGHSLAEWEGYYTPRQATMAVKVLRKYHRQLPPALYALAIHGQKEEVPA